MTIEESNFLREQLEYKANELQQDKARQLRERLILTAYTSTHLKWNSIEEMIAETAQLEAYILNGVPAVKPVTGTEG